MGLNIILFKILNVINEISTTVKTSKVPLCGHSILILKNALRYFYFLSKYL